MEIEALRDPNYAAKIIGQAKFVVDTIRDQVDMMNKLSNKNIPMDAVGYLDNHIEIIKDAAKKVNEEDEPSDAEIKRNKGLAKAKEELAQLTREMKALARKYKKAEGLEKEQVLNLLKSKTKLKKELEAIIDK